MNLINTILHIKIFEIFKIKQNNNFKKKKNFQINFQSS